MSISLKRIIRLIQKHDFGQYNIVIDGYKRSSDDFRLHVRLFTVNYNIGEIQYIKADLMILDDNIYGLFEISTRRKPVRVWHNIEYIDDRSFANDVIVALESCIRKLN